MRTWHCIGFLCASALCVGTAIAQTEVQPEDQPVTTNGIETMCTGVTTDVRGDSNWRAYPLRIEFTGKGGQYLGDEQVTLSGNGKSVSVHCAGPWVLMKLPKGTYMVSADVPDAGHKEMTVQVPGRVMMRFAAAGGAISPQTHVPAE